MHIKQFLHLPTPYSDEVDTCCPQSLSIFLFHRHNIIFSYQAIFWHQQSPTTAQVSSLSTYSIPFQPFPCSPAPNLRCRPHTWTMKVRLLERNWIFWPKWIGKGPKKQIKRKIIANVIHKWGQNCIRSKFPISITFIPKTYSLSENYYNFEAWIKLFLTFNQPFKTFVKPEFLYS